MTKQHKYIFFVFFALLLSVFIVSPKKVYAADVLAYCQYTSYDKKGKMNYQAQIVVHKDYTMTGKALLYNGGGVSDSMLETTNANNLSKIARNKGQSSVCPKYVSIRKHQVSYNGPQQKITYNIRGYYKKETMKKACKSFEKKSDGFISFGPTKTKNTCTELNNTACLDGTDTSLKCGSASKKSEETKNKQNFTDCESLLGSVSDENSIAFILQKIFNYIKILGPLLVIILSSMDFTKVVMTGDEKSMKKAQNNLGIRLVCAALLFFLPNIIVLLFNIVLDGSFDATSLCGIN